MADFLASLSIPLLLCLVGLTMLLGKRSFFDSFVAGAREGLSTAVGLFPTLLALMVAIGMLRASGVLNLLSSLLSPVTDTVGIPSDLLPLLLTRPFSGSASTATFVSLMEEYGPDSFVSLCASVIMGSSDTLVYVLGVYFSSVGVKKTRYAFPVAILVMLFSVVFSCLCCRLLIKIP